MAEAEAAPVHMIYYNHDNETEEIIRESVADICLDVMTAIDSAWISGLEIPIATAVAMHKLRQIVNLSVYPMDGNIPNLEVRSADREPAPPSIDAWARGVVPTRQKVETDDERFMSRVGTSGSGTPSVASSYRSAKSGTKMSAFGGSGRSRVSSGEGFGHTRSGAAGNHSDPEIFDLDDSRPSTQDGKMNDKFEKYRRAQRRKNKNNPIVADVMEKDEFEMMKETLESGKKGIKGRYAIDGEGKPIPIAGTKPEDLPRFSMDLAANITSFQHNDADDAPIEAKLTNPEKKEKREKKVRIAGSRVMEESYFVPSKSLATALSETGTEKFNLKAGVVLKTGQVTLEGPMLPSDPKRMSRKEFLERKRGIGVDTGSLTSTLQNSAVSDGVDAGNSVDSLESATMGMSRTSKLTDVDALEGGKKKSPPNMTQETVTDRELGLGPVQSSGRPQPVALPRKPSAKQKEIIKDFNGGADKAGPRDRLPPAIAVPTSQKKKLPPPGSGKTVGHGLDGSSVTSGTSPNKNNSIYDNSSFGGDNSTIYTSSVASQRKEKGTVTLANSELARELYS